MKKITIRRKDELSHLPKDVQVTAITKIGSVYVGRQPLKGVEGKEEKELLNGILDVGPDHLEWPKHVKHYWANMAIKVPFEGIQLEIGKDEINKHGIFLKFDHFL